MSELTHADVNKILEIIEQLGDRDIHLELPDFKLHVTHGDGAASNTPSNSLPSLVVPEKPPQADAESTVSSIPRPDDTIAQGHVAVRAPTIGTFYRAASPGAKPYVEVGDHVEADDTVCVFDVMKLFSSLRAGVAGTITAILVQNETLVQQDQPLIVIKPD